MPVLPNYIAQTEARGALRVDPRVGNVGPGLGEVSEGLNRFADVLIRSKEQDAAADAALKIAKAQSDWQANFLQRQEQAAPGAPEFTPTLLKDFDEATEEIIGTGKTRLAQDFMRQRLAYFRSQLSNDSLQFEANARITDRTQKFAQAAELTATSAELDPDNYAVRMNEQLAALEVLDVPPAVKAKMADDTRDLIRGRAAIGYARRDPDLAMKRLVTPAADDALFRTLSPRARDETLREIEATQRVRLQAEDRAYRDAQRAEADLQDAMSKEGDKRLSEGTLSAAWIEANRGRLSADDYRYFRRALSGEGSTGPRDVAAYADLRDRASRGEDIRSEARAALADGKIGATDFDRLYGEVEASRPGWYKMGVDFINVSGKPSELNPEEGAQQRLANMLDDWQVWADENPKATPAEARDRYRAIVEEYDLLDTKTMSITLPRPRFMVGDRNAPDLDATAAETVRALQENRISQEDAQRQALLIKQWKRAVERQGGQQQKGAK